MEEPKIKKQGSIKKTVQQVKDNSLVKRAIAPKNRFWNAVRWAGLILGGAAVAIDEGGIGPEWLQGVAAGVKWIGGTAFVTAQLTTK